jgi:hypothetical protein
VKTLDDILLTELVSANETWPHCPRCTAQQDGIDWFADEDHEEGPCRLCGQMLLIGNVFDSSGSKRAYEL